MKIQVIKQFISTTTQTVKCRLGLHSYYFYIRMYESSYRKCIHCGYKQKLTTW